MKPSQIYVYAALKLTSDSQRRLIPFFTNYILPRTKLHKGQPSNTSQYYGDHVTLAFGTDQDDPSLQDWIVSHSGRVIPVRIIGWGENEKALALHVAGDFPSKNAHPHITLLCSHDGKPSDSNQITDWYTIDPDVVPPLSGLCWMLPRSNKGDSNVKNYKR